MSFRYGKERGGKASLSQLKLDESVPALISAFCSMKRLEVFLLPFDMMLVHGRSPTSILPGSPRTICWLVLLLTWVERGTVRVICSPRTWRKRLFCFPVHSKTFQNVSGNFQCTVWSKTYICISRVVWNWLSGLWYFVFRFVLPVLLSAL